MTTLDPRQLHELVDIVHRWLAAGSDACAAVQQDRRDNRVEALSGGVAPRSFRVTSGGESWVVRLAERQPSGALAPTTEREVACAAAAAGVAPQVVAHDASQRVLVSRYLAGSEVLTPARLRQNKDMEAVAALLRPLHALEIPLRSFEPDRIAADYLRSIGGLAALAPQPRALGAEFTWRAKGFVDRYRPSCLCHNDLVASNLLDDGRLWLIDFEYAVRSAPILDLAGLVALNDLDGDAGWRLVRAYYAHSAIPFGPEELDGVVRLVRLMGYFWALATARRASDPSPYQRFAHEASKWFG